MHMWLVKGPCIQLAKSTSSEEDRCRNVVSARVVCHRREFESAGSIIVGEEQRIDVDS